VSPVLFLSGQIALPRSLPPERIVIITCPPNFCAGNAEADQDIIRFYVAKQQLLAKLQASSGN